MLYQLGQWNVLAIGTGKAGCIQEPKLVINFGDAFGVVDDLLFGEEIENEAIVEIDKRGTSERAGSLRVWLEELGYSVRKDELVLTRKRAGGLVIGIAVLMLI